MLVLSCFIFNLGGCLKLCGKGKVLYMVNRLYKKVITPGAGYMHVCTSMYPHFDFVFCTWSSFPYLGITWGGYPHGHRNFKVTENEKCLYHVLELVFQCLRQCKKECFVF